MNQNSELLYSKARALYQVPGDHKNDVYIIGLSGGADSTVLVDVLLEIAPEIDFQLVFTDTGAEPDQVGEILDRIESERGVKVARLLPELDLFQTVDKHAGFLPGPTSRWCTRVLKKEPFEAWIRQFDGRRKFIFSGVRSDEPWRTAFTLQDAETEMPFVDIGVTRSEVFAHLSAKFGVPRYYRYRSRSGCDCCFFQRRSEVVGLYQEQPLKFYRASNYEKLSRIDQARHDEAEPLWKEMSLGRNWLNLPLPEVTDKITKGRMPKEDLFGRRLYVGGEFFFEPPSIMEAFCFHQRVVSFSTSLAGLKRQLDGRYAHLLDTAEAFDMRSEDVPKQVKFAIWVVELPSDVFDPSGPSKGDGTYTWKSDSSYRQIAHVLSWVERALQAEHQRQLATTVNSLSPISVDCEWAEEAQASIQRASGELGTVVARALYEAKLPPPMEEEEILKVIPCPLCAT
jgi:hypothetical protein